MYTVLKKNKLLVFLIFVTSLFILGSCNSSSVDTIQGEESLSSGSGGNSTEPEENEDDSEEENEDVIQNENNARNDEGNADENDSGNEEENDVENTNDSSAGKTYVSEEFDFTIDLPKDWVDIVDINTTPFSSELDGAVNFIYAPTDTIEQMVFSILVVSGSVAEEQKENPFWVPIGTHKGYTFGYITPGEPVAELLEPENSDKLEYVQDMLYIDLPEIMETFRFGES